MKAFSEAVRAIYAAALSPEDWPEALARISDLFDSRGTIIYFANADGEIEFIASEGVRDCVRLYQAENWARRSVVPSRLADMQLASGDVVDYYDLFSPDEMAALPMYRDFFQRAGLGRIIASRLLPDLDMLVAMAVGRTGDRENYGPEDREALRLIGRHVEQALRISLQLAGLEAAETVQRAALEAVNFAVLGLDDRGRLAFANAAGEALFPDLLVANAERVTPRTAEEEGRLEAILNDALAAETADVAPHCAVLTRVDGARVAVWALPVTPGHPWRAGAGDPLRILLVATPVERDHRLDPAVVRDAFELTLGEARLAALIGDGVTLDAAALRLGVTEGTARVVLKRVFRKLGVSRQAELVRHLTALGGVRRPQRAVPTRAAGGRRRPPAE